jgi:glucosamine 6-phosphate synthetase-like amidotransferase/phosphosugar isomerase protein
MCGIFGVVLATNANVSRRSLEELLERLYRLSESRGKESAGLHVSLPVTREAFTFKSALPASQLLTNDDFRQVLDRALGSAYGDVGERPTQPVIAMAHSRLVTNGRAERPENN